MKNYLKMLFGSKKQEKAMQQEIVEDPEFVDVEKRYNELQKKRSDKKEAEFKQRRELAWNDFSKYLLSVGFIQDNSDKSKFSKSIQNISGFNCIITYKRGANLHGVYEYDDFALKITIEIVEENIDRYSKELFDMIMYCDGMKFFYTENIPYYTTEAIKEYQLYRIKKQLTQK